MDAVKKLVKKLRGQYKPGTAWDIEYAETQAHNEKVKMWEIDKKIRRDQSFEKAKLALVEYRKERQLEKERQAEIHHARLENLKKARRALRRARQETE